MALSNIQGLKGLTASERESWEKEQLSNIGADFGYYDEARKDRLYRNQQFYNTFGQDENYSELVKLTPEQRDRYYADKAFYDVNKDKMSAKDMAALPSQERDAMYNESYVGEQVKNLYGDTDVWNQITYKDKEGNEQFLYEPETLQDLLNSGIKPESEIADYERAGVLGNIYKGGQKRLADGDLDLLTQSAGSAGANVGRKLWKTIWGATAEAATAVGTFIGDVATDAVNAGKFATRELLYSDSWEDFKDRLKSPDFEWQTPGKYSTSHAGEAAVDVADKIERSWLRDSNKDAWAELQEADRQRKMDKGREAIDALAQNLSDMAYQGGDEGRAEVDKYFDTYMEMSPYYRQFKDTKYVRNLTYDDKARMTAEAMYMANTFNPEVSFKYIDNSMHNYLAESMDAATRLGNGAYDIFAQALAGVAGYFIGQESMAYGMADALSDKEYGNFRKGFTADDEQLAAWRNPIYWENISQLGTMDWDEIKRIKYGVGEKAYQEYAAKHKQEDPTLTDQQIEDAWIKEQWDQGMFRGDQISKHTNVYKTTEENDFLGLQTFYGAAGMSGQVLSQFLLARGVGGVGKVLKLGAEATKMAKTAKAIEGVTPYAQILMPTLPIAESYAQGAYEKTLTKNRETLDNWFTTPEAQELVAKRYNENSDYYIDRALDEVRAEAAQANASGDIQGNVPIINRESPYIIARAKALAEEDEKSQWYGHLDEGADAAFWTSFGMEAVRYGVFNMFNRQWIFGNAARKIKGVGPEVKMTAAGAEPAVQGFWSTAKDVAKSAGKEMWNSGRTNYCDELTTGFAVGFGSNLPTDYMGRIRQNNSEFTGFYGALLNGLNDLVDVADDTSSIQAFTTGALGFLVGGNMANVATAWALPSIRAEYSDAEKAERIKNGLDGEMSAKEARELFRQKLGLAENEYSNKRKALEWAAYLTGNSALLNVSERLQRIDDAARIANNVNATLAKNAELLNVDATIREMASLVAAREAAIQSGEEMSLKDVNYMEIFHALKTLQDMREQGTQDTQAYEGYMQTLRGYAEGRITEEDVKSFLHNPENEAYVKELGNEDQQTEFAKERLQKNAEKFLEVNEAWQRNKEVIDKNIGDLSKSDNEDYRDFYYDLLFKMSWSEDAANRLGSLEQSIHGSEELNESTTPMIQRLIADKGGNREFVQELSKNIEEYVAERKGDLEKEERFLKMHAKRKNAKKETLVKHQEKAENIQREIDRFQRLQNKYKDTLAQYDEVSTDEAIAMEDKTPIMAERLLTLGTEERLFVFTHPEVFSKAQQVQIEKARTQLQKNIGSDYMSALRDAHLLKERAALTDEYIANCLNGDHMGALVAIRTTKQNEVHKTIQWLADEKMKSIVPLVRNRVTKRLLSALVGIPITDAAVYAKYVTKDPAKLKTIMGALGILAEIKKYDYAIETAGLTDAEKRRASDLIYAIISNAKEVADIHALLMDYLDSQDSDSADYKLLIKVFDKQIELQNQTTSTENNESNEVKEESPKQAEGAEGEKKLTAEEQLIEGKVNKETGEYRSLDVEDITKLAPDAAPATNNTAGETTELTQPEALPANTQGTAMQGNWINGYDVKTLRETGKQVAKKGTSPEDTYSRWLDWTALNGYQYQNIVDFELAKIIEANPETPIHLMAAQGIGEATQDVKIKDAIMLVVEATDAVKKIHNEEYGHYIQSNGKEYLLIGRAGLEKSRTQEQEANYASMSNNINAEKDEYFKAHPEERFYVSDKYATQVRYIQGGIETDALIGEDVASRDIMNMLGDAKRDPFGIGKLENMAWYIQIGNEAREPIGLPSQVVREGRYYTPADKAANNGALFAMVPTGNGKYFPIKVTAATLSNIKDGKFKDLVRAAATKIASPNYDTRHEGITDLLRLVVLDGNNNVLIGSKDINAISIVRDGETLESMRFDKVSPEEMVEAIMSVPFRVNVNQTTFQDPVRMKQLAEAGAFYTDAAVLGGTGVNYTVYAMDENGQPMKETTQVGNSGYVHKTPVRETTVPYKGAMARLKNGQWVVEELGKETRVVTSPTEKLQLDCAAQIQEQNLVPVESQGNWRYFVLSADRNAPLVVKKNINTGEVDVPSQTQMLAMLDRVEKKAADKAAKQALDQHNAEASERGRQMQIGAVEETSEAEAEKEDLEATNQERAAQGTLMNIGETTTSAKEKTAPVQEKVSEDTKKVSKDLHMSEKSSNFVELYKNPKTYDIIDDVLVEKYGAENIPDKAEDLAKFLEKKGIPTTGITDIDAWIDLVEHCK